MRSRTKRLRVGPGRMIGLRRPVRPKPSPDLRVFREMSKLSRAAIRMYIDGLIGTWNSPVDRDTRFDRAGA
jgi:hypothetical protein